MEIDKLHNAHFGDVTGCDCNPNKANYFATIGEDNYIKFWDLRKLEAPIAIHYNMKCYKNKVIKYNRLYDQLLLVGSNNSRVDLWRVLSASSACITSKAQISSYTVDDHDELLKSSEHENSIYECEWSLSDDWTYATLDYEGYLKIECVPSEEKYKILI